ncbi:MAG: hypothetical protein RMK29_09815 [Myxococcales bacterium]|nr:hypothetical protein [Myxococcales bacterium]
MGQSSCYLRGMVPCSWRAALTMALVILGGAAPAPGHPQFTLSVVNRYSRLALMPRGQVRLTYTIMVGDIPAFNLRRGADRDGDGRLSEAEGAALARQLLGEARAGLRLEANGQPVALHFAEPTIGLAGDAVAPAALSVDTSASVRVASGQVQELRYEDRVGLAPAGEIEILVEPGPGIELIESCQGAPRPEQPQRITTFRFYGPPSSSLSDRSITVRFLERAPPSLVPHRLLLLAGAGLMGLLALAGLGWRRYRRMKGQLVGIRCEPGFLHFLPWRRYRRMKG